MGLRNLGAIDPALLDDNITDHCAALKIEFPAPTGTLRYIQRVGGFVGDIDGSSQTWNEFGFLINGLTQSRTKPQDVSYFTVPNLDNVWSAYVLNVQIEDRKCSIYDVWFHKVTGEKMGQFLYYVGSLDRAGYRDGWYRISVIPSRSGYRTQLPNLMDPGCRFIYGDVDTCQASAGTLVTFPTCDRTRKACEDRGNTAHFGGFDEMGQLNVQLIWSTPGGFVS